MPTDPSPITHTISSAARGVLQTVLAVAILHEGLSFYRVLGIAITSIGTCFYTWVRAMERRVKKERGEQPPDGPSPDDQETARSEGNKLPV